MESRHTFSDRVPIRAASVIWSNLPMLLLMDAAISVAAVPAVLLFLSGGGLLAPFVAALCVGPMWAAATRCAMRMMNDEVVAIRGFVGAIRSEAGAGIRVSLVPATLFGFILGTLAIMEARPDADWMFLPLIADGSVFVLSLIGATFAFPLALAGIQGASLWKMSFAAAVSRPGATLGAVALVVLLVSVGGLFPAMIPLIPAPLAVYLSVVAEGTIPYPESPNEERSPR